MSRVGYNLTPEVSQGTTGNIWFNSHYTEFLASTSYLYAAQSMVYADEDDYKDSARQSQGHLGYTVLDTFHDPFLGGGQDLSQRQLSLIHIYMRDLAPAFFGTPKTQSSYAYSPGIHITEVCLKHSSAASQWTSILAEEMINSMGGSIGTSDAVILRGRANQALKIALANFRKDFQAAYLAIIKSAQLAIFVKDMKTYQIMYRAAEMAIQSVGGLEHALSLTPDVPPTFMVVFPFYGATISTPRMLEVVVPRFLDALQQILQQNDPRYEHPIDDPQNDYLKEGRIVEDCQKLEERIVAAYKYHIPLAVISPAAPFKAIFLALIELCWTFIVLRQQPEIRFGALRYLSLLLDSCASMPSRLRGSDLYTVNIANTTAFARRESLGRLPAGTRMKYDFFITQTEIDAYRILDFEFEPGRTTVLMKLYAWLMQDHANNQTFSKSELEVLTNQILQSWKRRHASR